MTAKNPKPDPNAYTASMSAPNGAAAGLLVAVEVSGSLCGHMWKERLVEDSGGKRRGDAARHEFAHKLVGVYGKVPEFLEGC